MMSGHGQNLQKIAENAAPLLWSPSGKHLLFQRGNQLFTADTVGTKPKLLYEDKSIYQIGAETGWLNDSIVLLQVWLDKFDPHIYYLNVETGTIQKPSPDYWRVLEAVSVKGQYWIQSSDAGFEIADLAGRRVPILQDFNFSHTTQPAFDPNIVFLPSGEAAFFSACVSGSCSIYRAEFPDRQPGSVRVIFEWGKEGERNLWNLSVSPDGRYLAFVLGENELQILDVGSQTEVYKCPWRESYYPVYYIWSPFSDAIIYASQNEGSKYLGIRRLEVSTCQSQFLTDGTFQDEIADWKYISEP